MFVVASETASSQTKNAGGETTVRGTKIRCKQTGNHAQASGILAGSASFLGAAILSIFPAPSFAQSTYIVPGDYVSLSDSDGSNAAAASQAITNDGTLDIAATINGSSIQSLGGSGFVLLGGRTLTLTNANDTFAGGISGSGGLKLTTGLESLSGTNTYSGATAIDSNASLKLVDSGSIANSSSVAANGIFDISETSAGASVQNLSGSGSIILGGQTLTLDKNNVANVFSGLISGSGGLFITGGALTLTGVNDYTGVTNVKARLVLKGDGSIAESSEVINNSRFDISATNNGASVKSLSGSGAVILGGQTLTLTNASGTFTGSLNGSGGLTITGGTETLSGNNTYTGATVIDSDATLALSGNGGIANSSGVTADGTFNIAATANGASITSLSGSGAVILGGQTLTLANASNTFSGAISGAGGLTLAAGTEVLSGANTYTGATSINNGAQLVLDGGGSIANSSTVINNGIFDISATSNGASVKGLSGSGDVILGGQTLTLTNASGTFAGILSGSGGIAVTGGVQTLSGNNTYTGGTMVANGGVLRVLSDASLGALNSELRLNGGTLEAGGDIAMVRGITLTNSGKFNVDTPFTASNTGTVSGNGTLIKGGGGILVLSGTVANNGGVQVDQGILTLSGNNTYTGGTTMSNGGVLRVSSDANLGASNSGLHFNGGTLEATGDIAMARDITLINSGTLNVGSPFTVSNTGAVSGNGTLIKDGGGVLVLSGTVANNGGVQVNQGRVTLSGNNTYTGATTINNGAELVLNGSSIASSSNVINNGTFNIEAMANGASVKSLSGGGTVILGGQTLTMSDASGAFAGSISGSGGVSITGGVQALSGNNTYTGNTTVTNGGTVSVAADNSLGAGSSDVILKDGRLRTTESFTSNRNLIMAGQNSFVDTVGGENTLTWAGNLSGSGHLIKEGAGTLILAGDNAGGQGAGNTAGSGWTGGLTINGGFVKVTNPYGMGWGDLTWNSGTIQTEVDLVITQNLSLGAGAGIDTAAGVTATFIGNVDSAAGSGCFTKTGLGTLNVAGTAAFDSTCVLGGRLLANGNLNSVVTVEQGGTLGGSGTINGPVTVRGTLSPGNSPGMLTANSTITMTSGSTFKEDIAGTRQASASTPVGVTGYYSYLRVTGNNQFVIQPGSTLAPTLKNIFSAGEPGYGAASFVPPLGQSYRIITADGGVLGRFDKLVQPDGLAEDTRLAVFYNVGGSNSIDLKVLPSSYSAWARNGNANSRSAAAILDRIDGLEQAGTSSAVQSQLMYIAANQNADTLRNFMKGLSGEVHGALAAATPQAGWAVQNSVGKHLTDSGRAEASRALWIDLAGNHGNWKGDDSASGFSANRTQLTLGADVLDTANAQLGFGFSHARSNISADMGSGSVAQNMGFVYGRYGWNGFIVDGLAAYGRNKMDSSRADPAASTAALTAHAGGNSKLIGIGVRAPWRSNGAIYEPFARLTYQKVERDAVNEVGSSAAALGLDGFSSTGTRLMAGLAGSSSKTDPLTTSRTYKFSAGVGMDSGNLSRASQQASLAGVATTINAPHVGRVFLQGGVTGTMQLNSKSYAYVGLTGEARSGYTNVGGNVGVRMSF